MNATGSRNQGGDLLASISKRIVAVLRESSGRGPSRCKTHWAGDDMVIVQLDGGYLAGERTLAEAGHVEEVLDGRAALQDSVREEMQAIVREEVGRDVAAFMSASNVNPDMMVEIFVLERPGRAG